MTVLVTGGAGFIGGKLVEELLSRGEKVRVFDLRASSATHLADLGAEMIDGDVLSRDQVRQALTGCERLFHVAALFQMWQPDRRSYYRVNVEGTRNVLEAALDIGVRRGCAHEFRRHCWRATGASGPRDHVTQRVLPVGLREVQVPR